MGGGVAMRAAAKVAGLGVLNGGGLHNPVVRRSVASVVSSSSTSDDLKLAIKTNSSDSSSVEIEKPYPHYPTIQDDDWEFADEMMMMPRVVFGGDAPTIQEAKQATSDLTDALHKSYLSQHPFDLETKPCLVTQTYLPSKPAIQAFRLLHENPHAQNVVASIASDLNVWNAVMKNEALVDFLHTHNTSVDSPQVNEEESSDESKSASGKGFRDYMEDIKQKITVTVADMMTTLADTFQSFFGGKDDEYAMNPDGTAGISVEKTTIGATLMGLAIMVITVVVLKRA